MALHIQFDANQEHQRLAIESVVNVFNGLPHRSPQEFTLADEIIPNLPPYEDLAEEWLHGNVQAIQHAHGLQPDMTLAVDEGMVLEGAGSEVWRYPSVTLEMETGTGKTYVYLRTIHELRQRYGFGKFIIIVPSVAIYEGVIKMAEITKDHFRALYGNEVVNIVRYDSDQISRLRTFATSTFCEVMVMTLDSFNRISNRIFKASEKLPGERKPHEFLQETRPILILDEPQNMTSTTSKEALRTLHPLMALRYSATHKESPNLLYRLTPFDAFRQNLVKKIEVCGVSEQNNPNRALLALQAVTGSGIGLRATVSFGEQSFTLKRGEDLFEKTKNAQFRDGYVVAEVNAGTSGGDAFLEFANTSRLVNGGLGLIRKEVFRLQIREAIRTHLRRQERLRGQGIKVLSLFFIDRVKNFTDPDGIIRLLFDEEFNILKREYPHWQQKDASAVRSAYFAQVRAKTGEMEDIETRDTEDGKKNEIERKAERVAFDLIMKKKEKLLSFGEPVSFIFAHSALKEGWDNPNVFQICTLNQTVSVTKKRQEIGRGLRLCVNQEGARVQGDDVNVLTVVANASYQKYAEELQKDYERDGDTPPPAPTDANRAPVVRRDSIFHDPGFRNLWSKLAQPVTTTFNLDTDELVLEAANRLNHHVFSKPILVVERGAFVQTQATFRLLETQGSKARVQVSIADSDGNEETSTKWMKLGDKPGSDDRLRDFRVAYVTGEGDAAQVRFGNDIVLTPHQEYAVSLAANFKPQHRETMAPQEKYPVGNLIDRAARKTELTRHTIRRIFHALHPDKAQALLENPEGFTTDYISIVTNALADQIADRIAFTPGGIPAPHDLDVMFPETKDFVQRELRAAGPQSLYDQVQIDSNVEINFIQVVQNDASLLFYFKFPPTFKVPLPAQIGNYNPDWGLARLDAAGIALQYIRETKGTENLEKLQFKHERRKIICAQKYFAAIGMDYRPVMGTNADWWKRVPQGSFKL